MRPQIDGELLDTYLENGWYRMSNSIFTTDSIDTGDVTGLVNVYWARYVVNQFTITKKLKDIFRLNLPFTTEIFPLSITEEMEKLYTKYKTSIDFEISPTLNEYLSSTTLNEPFQNVFETYSIQVKEGSKLIAFGLLDNGFKSVAGLINVLDPDYKKYSLGKFIMLQKMNIAQQKNKKYYYPGYIATNWNKFDYKLFIGKTITEIYDRTTNTWLSYADWESLEK